MRPSAWPTQRPSPITGLLGTEWTRIPTTSRVVALTFDAGANAEGLTSILTTLNAKMVPATFFLTGDFVKNFPSEARRIGPQHRLGNHSVNHPRFTELTDTQIRSQVLDAGASIKRVTGAEPAPWFRFPYGDRNPRTIGLVNSAGYLPIGWTVDTLGWKGTSGGITGDRVLQRVLDTLAPGAIVMMHVGSHPTDHSTLDADTLPKVIDALRARGYGFVTLEAMLRKAAATS
ncbi:MAG TPA: polysaccharide deacetylase family protein [Jatrophihabitans sp.]|uniref:polysaccharide deacetylase family protein n=1 Tax=Jatrophihabitans sp. TaxID=1932789 RepID=UPI002EE699D9